ncbi:MAG: radical SAM protein [Planctomycetota bacterium]|nr:radical SAM protein [Planctomycetota bacterium]
MSRQEVDELIRRVGVTKAGIERKVAAILFTYRCSIACRHCLFGCAASRPDVVMDAERCVRYLGQLFDLGRVVHIAGGEAMLYWNTLKEVLVSAEQCGVMPHFVETNCSFAGDDALVCERFTFLKDHGLMGILLSCDPYHQEFVPPENFLRARRIGREVFGPENVWEPSASDDEVREFPRIVNDEQRLAEYVCARPPTFTGTAAQKLAPLVEPKPLKEVVYETTADGTRRPVVCAKELNADSIWEVHIDPYDNIQTNCGLIFGKADRTPLADVMKQLPRVNFIVQMLAEEGPMALAELARAKHGFAIPTHARQKCELCYWTRRVLHKHYPEMVGPAEIYA